MPTKEQKQLIADSGYFNTTWYAEKYPDVIDGPRKSDHWLRDKNRWLEEVKKTTTNHRNES